MSPLIFEEDDDTLDGGPDADYLYGNDGDDWLSAHDGTADHWISGGDGNDSANTDSPLDDAAVQSDIENFLS